MNLVVACDDCNSAKSNKDVDGSGQWLFVHPYFDDFLATSVLSSEVSIENGSLSVDFNIRDDIDGAALRRLERHVETLDIFSRYRDDPLREAVQIVEVHQAYFAKGAASVEDVRLVLADQGKRVLMARPNDPVGVILLSLSRAGHLEQLLTAFRGGRSLEPETKVATVGL